MPAQQHFSDAEGCSVFHCSFWQVQPKTQATEVVALPVSMLGSSMTVACSHHWHLTLPGWDTLKQGGGISVLGMNGWRCLLVSSESQAVLQMFSNKRGHESMTQQVPVPPLLLENMHLLFQISALWTLQWA